jgi:hypothetical protein
MKALWLLCITGCAYAQQTITLNAPSPTPVASVSARASTSGLGYFCYWVAAIYPIGKSYPTGPSCVANAGGSVTVTWSPASGATGYDVLRTTGPSLPSGAALIAVATAVSGTSQTDSLGGLNSYSVAGTAPAVANVTLDNQNFAQPRLIFDTPPQVGTLYFGDGTSQSTAGGGSGGGVNFCAPGSASGTAYTCTPSPAIGAYAAGTTLAFVPDVQSGASPTVNVNGRGFQNIKMPDGSTVPPPGWLNPGQTYYLTYDGANFRLSGPNANCGQIVGTINWNSTINGTQINQNTTSPVTATIISGLTADFRPSWAQVQGSTTFTSSDGTFTSLTVGMGRATATGEWIPTTAIDVLATAGGSTNFWYARPAPPLVGVGNTYNMAITFTPTVGKNMNTLQAGAMKWEVAGCFSGVAQ